MAQLYQQQQQQSYLQSQQPHPHQTYKCNLHDNEYFTNYCASLGCLQPLCPTCISDHQDWHKLQKTDHKFESIGKVKAQCNKKIERAIEQLEKEMSKANLKQMIDPQQLFEDGLTKIQQSKEKVLAIIDYHFKILEQNFGQRIQENQTILQNSNLSDITYQVETLIAELREKSSELDQSDHQALQALKDILLLDMKTLMNKFQKDIKKSTENLNLQNVDIQYDDGRMYNFKSELEKLVFIPSKEQLNTEAQKSSSQQMYYSPTQNMPIPSQEDFYSPVQQQYTNQLQGQNLPLQIQQHLQQNQQKMQLLIEQQNYFDKQCERKSLHYFNYDERLQSATLFTYHLNGASRFEEFQLEKGVEIKSFHQSIQLPNGDIYLIGGSDKNKTRSDGIFKYDSNRRKLDLVAKLQFGRSHHSLVYQKGYIYIIGGLTHQDIVIDYVEKFNPLKNTVERVASLNHKSFSSACCAYGDKYIFKLGGKFDTQALQMKMECYNILTNEWHPVDPNLMENENHQQFIILSNSGCCQISKNSIFVFGGQDGKDKGYKLTYVLEQDESNEEFYLKHINKKPLPVFEGCHNGQSVVYDKVVYCVQNQSGTQNNKQVLGFNGQVWKHIIQ